VKRLGFIQFTTIFVPLSPQGQCLLLFVDDVIIISDDTHMVVSVKQNLETKDLDITSCFLGVEVVYSRIGYFVVMT
jgi:hypothetical protein